MNVKLPSKNYATIEYFDQKKRDVLLILPGGGYAFASPREAQPVADAFSDLGLHTCVYQYRETILLYPEIHKEGLLLLQALKSDPLINNIHIIGFSAGGHLALMLLEKYHDYFASGILCYAVVSVRQSIQHIDSLKRLLGETYQEDIISEVSLEMHVHDKIPPIFIFHTVDDAVVPVGNALVLVDALHEHQVPVEAHLFPKGRHGISVATAEVAFTENTVEAFLNEYGYLHEWVNLARLFLQRHMS